MRRSPRRRRIPRGSPAMPRPASSTRRMTPPRRRPRQARARSSRRCADPIRAYPARSGRAAARSAPLCATQGAPERESHAFDGRVIQRIFARNAADAIRAKKLFYFLDWNSPRAEMRVHNFSTRAPPIRGAAAKSRAQRLRCAPSAHGGATGNGTRTHSSGSAGHVISLCLMSLTETKVSAEFRQRQNHRGRHRHRFLLLGLHRPRDAARRRTHRVFSRSDRHLVRDDPHPARPRLADRCVGDDRLAGYARLDARRALRSVRHGLAQIPRALARSLPGRRQQARESRGARI